MLCTAADARIDGIEVVFTYRHRSEDDDGDFIYRVDIDGERRSLSRGGSRTLRTATLGGPLDKWNKSMSQLLAIVSDSGVSLIATLDVRYDDLNTADYASLYFECFSLRIYWTRTLSLTTETLLTSTSTRFVSTTATPSITTSTLSSRDCQLADWSNWTECSRDCDGVGTQTRFRSIVVPASNGGSCPNTLLSERQCTSGCQHCSWSDWSDFSQWSASCNGGTRRRTRVAVPSRVRSRPQTLQTACEKNRLSCARTHRCV